MDSLYHYCSNETFISIIANREVWLSDLSMSNDSLEGKWAKEILLQNLSSHNATDQDIRILSSIFDEQTSHFSTLGLCLSENGDQLSQWRGYGDNGYGICIGFSESFLKCCPQREAHQQTVMDLVPVEYEPMHQQQILKETIEEIAKRIQHGAFRPITVLTSSADEAQMVKERSEIESSVFRLFGVLPRLKNPAFHEEQEWRLISILLKTLMPSPHIHKYVFYRGARNRIVPYQKIKLDQESGQIINEVIIGPRNISQTDTVKLALKQFGFNNVNVRVSRASYR